MITADFQYIILKISSYCSILFRILQNNPMKDVTAAMILQPACRPRSETEAESWLFHRI